ncbi:unnamed protein product [Owenia fusiformis]|uniref:Uncharacterized protein n=1 Tax=Owenia fusiformis TaxID=6347 RepID=A0A8S4NMI2_OWEFU|nr:unnamed protein product [Owenia fusiformis]
MDHDNSDVFWELWQVMVVFLMAIWERKCSPFVQFQFFASGVGRCISPLLVNLFVTPRTSRYFRNDTTSVISFWNESALLTLSNGTVSPIRENEVPMKSDVKYVFVIIGAYLGVIALLFCGIGIKLRTVHAVKQVSITPDNDGPKIPTWTQMSNKLYRIKMLIFVFLIYFTNAGVLITMSELVTTFAIQGLHWTKDHGTVIASVYGGAGTLSCILGVFATKILSLSQINLIKILTTVLSMIIMVAFVQLHASVLWLTVLVAGLSHGGLSATIYSWFQTNVMQVTGIVASISAIGGSLSAMSVPLLTATLMENVDFMYFAYMLLGNMVMVGVVAICIYVDYKKHTNRQL